MPEDKIVSQKVTKTTKQPKTYKLLLQKNLISKQARNLCSSSLKYMNNDKLSEDFPLVSEIQESNAIVKENSELLDNIQKLKGSEGFTWRSWSNNKF